MLEKDPFKEYLIEKEPTKKELGYSWDTAIGLQKVDGLETSKYLKELALDNINGKISLDEANELIKSYYVANNKMTEETAEADIVSANIAKVLSEKGFVFSVSQFLTLHKQIFAGVYDHAGKIRDYDISKKEWVLNGDTVIYGGASMLKETLMYDFDVEKNFDYSKLDVDDFIVHISRFIANLWQIHVFSEGNTRTTAVFLIKYLRKFGYEVTNDVFAENAWYFRNSLVRANYSNIKKGIHETTIYLERFMRNLLLEENNELKNRFLHVDWDKKVDIGAKKVDIQDEKVDIDYSISPKTKQNLNVIFKELKDMDCFGREDITRVLNLSNSGASKMISILLKKGLITPIKGHGKGKYRFNSSKIN